MFILFSLFSDWALLVFRLAFGCIFLAHGWPKLKNIVAAAKNFEAMGFKPGFLWGPLVAIVEFFGGLAFLGGLYVQIVAALIAVEFAVIVIWKIFKRQPFVGGWEFDFLIFAAALVLLTAGGGAYSFDRTIFFGGF